MSSELRIPFGLYTASDEIVDVHDVENGRNCGCICPSCKAPLIAKQGAIKEWHFAHATKSTYMQAKSECELSFYVSAVMMAKQLFMLCPVMHLPQYILHTPKINIYQNRLSHIQITKESRQNIEQCIVETEFEGIKIDVLTHIKGCPLAFFLTHKERTMPVKKSDFEGLKIGVVEIDFSNVDRVLHNQNSTVIGYKNRLSKFIFEDIKNKTWIYHPREALKTEQAKAHHLVD